MEIVCRQWPIAKSKVDTTHLNGIAKSLDLFLASAVLIGTLLTRFVHVGLVGNVVRLHGVEVAVGMEMSMSVEFSKWEKKGSSMDLARKFGGRLAKWRLGQCDELGNGAITACIAATPGRGNKYSMGWSVNDGGGEQLYSPKKDLRGEPRQSLALIIHYRQLKFHIHCERISSCLR